ncbi:MBL fold metallo-hydrolase [Haloglomus halophilum]|uniref:MBL fold metallo-hydrolase n=1 Tax=Haloglomus halophilum TaxID=2962672 RepID=UPI0020C972C9|nr:MBL fold metallo-hydrolase [Haloglomus halophilum]
MTDDADPGAATEASPAAGDPVAGSPEPEEAGTLTPADLQAWLDEGRKFTLLDTRNREEIDEWRIDAPRRLDVPYMKFVSARVTGGVADLVTDVDDGDPEGPFVAVCPRGEASAEVADLLADEGYEAYNLAGGMHGWARLYEAAELPAGTTPEGVTVLQYRRPSSGCLAYLVVAGDEAVVVDPLRAFAERYAADAREHGADLVAAVDTHVHADHVSGVRAVADATDAAAVLPAGATDRGLAWDATLLDAGETLDVGDTTLEAVAAPGHTTEMLAYRVGDLLLTGDSLFTHSVARPDLEAGDEDIEAFAATLHETLTGRFDAFDDGTLIAPGHYASEDEVEDGRVTARLGDLRESLDLLAVDRETFVERVLAAMPPRPANHETIIAVNLGRETADAEAAFELELGPNNCAATAD